MTSVILYRGAGVGTWWHDRDASELGLTPKSPGATPSADRLMQHIARSATDSPYVSLTRSYAVALDYAFVGRAPASPRRPGFVYEVMLGDPLPSGLQLVDPIVELAGVLPGPLDPGPYQHDGPQRFLIGLVDLAQRHYLSEPCPKAPGLFAVPNKPNLTLQLETLVFALRDSEILAVGNVPSSCVRRYEV